MKEVEQTKPLLTLGTVPTRSVGSPSIIADIVAILQLVESAQESISSCYGDELGAGFLRECASHLRDRYGLADTLAERNPAGGEVSVAALARLLVYVRTEAKRKLRDERCVSLLTQCIERLRRMHAPHSEELYWITGAVPH